MSEWKAPLKSKTLQNLAMKAEYPDDVGLMLCRSLGLACTGTLSPAKREAVEERITRLNAR